MSDEVLLTARRCTGCGHCDQTEIFRVTSQPVISNYRCESADEARSFPRGDITLVQCASCGLVFNFTFDGSLCHYDEKYDNRQLLSPAFQSHVDCLIASISEVTSPKNILEIGCGKGDFLKTICAKTKAQGKGYDTTYEGVPVDDAGRVRFFRSYVSSTDIQESFDLIICRHVVEHVPEIGRFFQELRDIAVAAGDPVIVIETPRLEWIVESGAFWDIFYEHCNYFTESALQEILRRAGFKILKVEPVFGEQYQLVEIRLDELGRATADVAQLIDRDLFNQRMRESLLRVQAKVGKLPDRKWAVWGAGAKGVAVANRISPPPIFVVDINKNKCGGFIPGVPIQVLAPSADLLKDIGLMVIMNPNYQAEIRMMLAELQFFGEVSVLSPDLK